MTAFRAYVVSFLKFLHASHAFCYYVLQYLGPDSRKAPAKSRTSRSRFDTSMTQQKRNTHNLSFATHKSKANTKLQRHSTKSKNKRSTMMEPDTSESSDSLVSFEDEPEIYVFNPKCPTLVEFDGLSERYSRRRSPRSRKILKKRKLELPKKPPSGSPPFHRPWTMPPPTRR